MNYTKYENERTGLEAEGIETGGSSGRSTGGSEGSRVNWKGEEWSWLLYKYISMFKSEIYNYENELTGLEIEGIKTGGTSGRSIGNSEGSRLDWLTGVSIWSIMKFSYIKQDNLRVWMIHAFSSKAIWVTMYE